MDTNVNTPINERSVKHGPRFVFLIDLLFLVAVACISGWSGWEAVSVYGDELSLSSQSHLFGLRPSVLFAAGLGLGRVDCRDGEFPELEAFMERKITSIPRSAYPESGGEAYGRNFHFYFHYYLIAYMGWMFRIFGVSVQTIHLACLVMHVASMLFLYLLLRLVMGRLLSLAGTAYVATMPAFLVVLPDFRDYGKTPFFLAVLLLMGYILKRPRSPRRQMLFACMLGAVTGVGYGFRQDLLICMPLSIFLLLFGAPIAASRSWRWRVAAALIAVAAFALTAAPVFKGRQESGGFLMAHTLLQGMTSSVEGEVHFGGADYDFGFLGLDTPVIASVNAYALRTGRPYPESYVSREYGEAGKSLFAETVRVFPADFIARAAATVVHAFHIPESRFIRETLGAAPYTHGGERLHYLDRLHAPVDAFFSRYGLACAIAAVLLFAARKYKPVFWICLLSLYFAAYPSLLAEFRHLFYLAFIPVFFLGLLLQQGITLVRGACGAGKGVLSRSWFRGFSHGVFRGTAFVVVPGIAFAIIMAGLRLFQAGQADTLQETYGELRLAPLTCSAQRQENKVLLSPHQTLAALKGKNPPERGEVLSAYLAVKFKDVKRTVTFSLLNENDAFLRSCTVRLNGKGIYYVPAFDFGAVTPAVFKGLEFTAEDYEFFEGLFHVENADELVLWPYIAIPENQGDFLAWKVGRLDLWAAFIRAELASGFGLFPEKALSAYLKLIPRHPYYEPYANRALAWAQRCGKEERLLEAYETIGISMPVLRSRVSIWITDRAKAFQETGCPEKAIRYYEAALKVMPTDLWNLVRIGEIQSASGNSTDAIKAFQNVLWRAPDSPYTAKLLDALYAETGNDQAAGAFWRELVDTYPEVAGPHLFHGIFLERTGNKGGAYDAYVVSLKIRPDFAPALYRRGALEAERGNTEVGIEMMKESVRQDPGLSGEVSERCAKVAEYYQGEERYATAVELSEAALEISPVDLWNKVRIGEIRESTGDFQEAERAFEDVLAEVPESPYTASKLDSLFERHYPFEHAIERWEELAKIHPEGAIPHLFLGISRERAGLWEDAYDAYNKTLAIKPDCAEALYRKGALEVVRGNIDIGVALIRNACKSGPELKTAIVKRCVDLIDDLEEKRPPEDIVRLCGALTEIFPDEIDFEMRLGMVLERQEDELEMAMNAYINVLKKSPDSFQVAHRIDMLMERMNLERQRALEIWEMLLGVHEQSYILNLFHGIELERMGDPLLAYEAYSKSLKGASDFAPALYRRGALEAERGNTEAGIEMMKRAAALDQGLAPNIAARCAQAAEQRVKTPPVEATIDLYKTAIEIFPEDLWPKVHLGDLYEVQEQHEAALACYREVLAAAPESPVTAKKMHGLLARIAADHSQIVAEWRQIADKQPKAAIPAFYLGKALEAAGDTDGARAAYEQALGKDKDLAEARESLDALDSRNER